MTGFEVSGSSDLSEPVAAGISRRTVLQAGAWSAPVIAVAAAVPAASASIIETLKFTDFRMWFDWDNAGHRTGIAGCTTVWLDGDPGQTAGPVTLVVSVPILNMSTTIEPTVAGAGWLFSSVEPDSGNVWMNYTFVWSGELVANGAAYTSTITFHLPADATLEPGDGLEWSASATAGVGIVPASWAGELVNLVSNASTAQLSVDAGSLTRQGEKLVWSGASIAYSGDGEASAEYFAELRRSDDVVITLLAHNAAVFPPTPFDFNAVEYLLSSGVPLSSGEPFVTLSVVGTDGVVTDATAPTSW